MLICMLAACGSGSSSGESASSKPEESSQSQEESKDETPQTDVLYAVLGPEYVREYSVYG